MLRTLPTARVLSFMHGSRRGFVAACLLASIGLASPAGATADNCGTVRQTRDGFLTLRSGPSTQFEAVLRFYPGDELWLDTAACTSQRGLSVCDETDRWRHITSVRRIDARRNSFTQGWAHARFLSERPCPER